MSKRGENIRKRKDGRWEARIKTDNGKLRSVYARSYGELKEKLREQGERRKAAASPVSTANANTARFSEICSGWLSLMKIKNKKSTVARYTEIVKNHLIPFFEDIEVSPESVNRFIIQKTNADNLSPKTVYDIITVLAQVIRYAQNRELIAMFKFDISRPTITKSELEVLTPQEQARLMDIIMPCVTAQSVGILLSLYTGLRIGEICALQWGDIDLAEGIISVTKTMQRIPVESDDGLTKTMVIIDAPKSQKSVRKIPIPEFLVFELKNLSRNVSPDDYVITSGKNFIEPRLYQYKFKKYLEMANVRNINFHALRHTFATRAVEQSMDLKALSEILGHSTVNFTLEQYVHISFDFKKQNMEKLSAFYKQSKEGSTHGDGSR